MKLRVKGNSIRFRLGRSEVDAFGLNGSIEEQVRFGPNGTNALCYRLEKTDDHGLSGSFEDGTVTVRIPANIVDEWVVSSEVSVEGIQKLDETSNLKFLIEKDFVCLNAHNDEDQSDRYPHPKGSEAC